MFYAGIGSRRTPPAILALMQKIGARLGSLGFVLRSGGAQGADQAFQQGAASVGAAMQIFLPWPGFEGHKGSYVFTSPAPDAFKIVAPLHPKWDSLTQGARRLHARNAHQVLGPRLNDPVRFVVCWTPDGAEQAQEVSRDTGGTGMGIRLASLYGIRVFNLAREGRLQALGELIRALRAS